MSQDSVPATYIVRRGDTLGTIAASFGISVRDLAEANGISNLDLILEGQTLRVAPNDQVPQASPTLQLLFVDKLLRAIPGLEFVLERHGERLAEGATNADGLSEVIVGVSEGERVDLLVRRVRGGYKRIYSTIVGRDASIITAYSPALLVKASTETHEGNADDSRSAEGHPLIKIDQGEVRLDFLERDSGERIDASDYESAARVLGCEVAAIEAVAQAETGSMGSFFNLQGWDSVPAILFERHYFHRFTGGAFDASHPDISNRRAGAGGTWSDQYRKLLRAYALDADAALKSASWSKFQIMGANHSAAGHGSVREMVRAASTSEKNHLRMFVSFISADPVLLRSLVNKDWLAFARRYNGPAQKGYDHKMRENYEAISQSRGRND